MEDILLVVDPKLEGSSLDDVFHAVQLRRNVVQEMVVTRRAIKLIRDAQRPFSASRSCTSS